MSAYTPYESACYRGDCNGLVCLSAEQHQAAWEQGEGFCCSHGHRQVFTKTKHQTYEQLEGERDRLRDSNSRLERDVRWYERKLDEVTHEHTTCPFDECRAMRHHYTYSSQTELLRHLQRKHGIDIYDRVAVANMEHEESLAETSA